MLASNVINSGSALITSLKNCVILFQQKNKGLKWTKDCMINTYLLVSAPNTGI